MGSVRANDSLFELSAACSCTRSRVYRRQSTFFEIDRFLVKQRRGERDCESAGGKKTDPAGGVCTRWMIHSSLALCRPPRRRRTTFASRISIKRRPAGHTKPEPLLAKGGRELCTLQRGCITYARGRRSKG